MSVKRMDPEKARAAIKDGAMLVCAYDDDEKCMHNHLPGAINFSAFKASEGEIPKEREIISCLLPRSGRRFYD